ncbi:pectinesterase family protein [Tropicimonas sediminicola]|uniref:Pectinesterase n=1 Tax=Tropicimonas sediminicola TaxID=1031541 RepID=A0A239LLF5_9RHOB|nr:pectinesterase family protein [Tropicimonas sediminicola]SNT30718.1 Pectin methylesterase [Tropicimonas sediminicola]
MSRFPDWPPDAAPIPRTALSRGVVLSGAGLKGLALAYPWVPEVRDGDTSPDDYIVDSEAPADPPRRFRTLQAAVDQAIRDGAGARDDGRRVIRIAPGFYRGPVFLPAEAPPLSLLGAGSEKVTLAARIDAQMPGREYEERFDADFAAAPPPVRAQFARIAARERITTGNTAVLRIERSDTCVAGLTIRNDYACDRREAAPPGAVPDVNGRYAHGQHQAVACHVAGADRVQLLDLHLESFQDTLYLQSPVAGIGRSYLSGCRISGDVDFIFGGATAFFDRCEVVTRGSRGARSWALAPSTNLWMPHGFVFDRCRFSHDGSEAGRDGTSFLGRQWFEGVRATPYCVPNGAQYRCVLGDADNLDAHVGQISRRCLEAVGKCIVLNSQIGAHISRAPPWDAWSAGDWSPRYRPVQASGREFLRYLDAWLAEMKRDYACVCAHPAWLRVENCTTCQDRVRS